MLGAARFPSEPIEAYASHCVGSAGLNSNSDAKNELRDLDQHKTCSTLILYNINAVATLVAVVCEIYDIDLDLNIASWSLVISADELIGGY